MDMQIYNENLKFFYSMQKDETEHQSRRMLWGLSTQALLFAGLTQLFNNNSLDIPYISEVTVVVLGLLGICVSISSVYSMIVGDLSVSRIFLAADQYEAEKENIKVTKRWVMTAPKVVLNCWLKFLPLYSFIPKAFCAAWISIPISVILLNNGLFIKWYYLTIILFLFTLTLIIIFSHCFFECMRKKMKDEDNDSKQTKQNCDYE